jgi:hypothetical protein
LRCGAPDGLLAGEIALDGEYSGLKAFETDGVNYGLDLGNVSADEDEVARFAGCEGRGCFASDTTITGASYEDLRVQGKINEDVTRRVRLEISYLCGL